MYKLYRVSLNIRSLPKWDIPKLSGQILLLLLLYSVTADALSVTSDRLGISSVTAGT